MAFAAAALTAEPRSWSIGPWKLEIQSCTAASGDTTGTVTAKALTTLISAHPTFHCSSVTVSGKVATLAYTDPSTPGIAGFIILIGR